MTTEARRIMASLMSEQQLLDAVIERARGYGWRVVHFRPAKTAKGWRTAVQGDGKGWPDLLMLRAHRGIAAELKSQSITDAKVPDEQWEWLKAFSRAHFEAYLWRPSDWLGNAIDLVLQ